MPAFLRRSLLVLVALFLFAPAPSLAQDELAGDEQAQEIVPSVSFAVRLMQSGQFLRASDAFDVANDDATAGFHRVRFNLELNVDLHERVRAFVDLGHEPNDFGDDFEPSVDFVALDLLLSDAVTLRLGTPVTTLFNFRGYSDGAAVQDNPLIGNSPIDMVTAETGVQLIGAFGPVQADLTATVPTFFEDFGPGRGLTLIAKAAVEAADAFSVGAGYALGVNSGQVGERPFGEIQRMGMVMGDGENYNFPSSGAGSRDTHSGVIPGVAVQIVHADAELRVAPLLLRAWGGYAVDGYSFARPPLTPRLFSLRVHGGKPGGGSG
jgi:hypothetical protein